MSKRYLMPLLGVLSFIVLQGSSLGLPAFPGAEGFGSSTPAGRGGVIVEVTNLNDSGPGSLRYALQDASGPRIVVFRTGGTINLNSPIKMSGDNDSFVTVAGQTAPGEGIQLKNYGIEIQDGAHDIVIRYLRVRVGTGGSDWDVDAIGLWGNNGKRVYNVVVDHCSLEWAIDENAQNWEYVTDVTYQWNIIAEGSMTGHEKGVHSMGFIVGDDSRNTVTLHHNLFAHNDDRNPRINAATVDFRNNVVYNWGPSGASAQLSNGARANFVNNYYIKGPDTTGGNEIIWMNGGKIYLSGTWGPGCEESCQEDWSAEIYGGNKATDRVSNPFDVPKVTTHPTSQVKDLVLAEAGARLPALDEVDGRIVQEVRTQSGALGIGSGYPALKTGTPYADADHDGMADSWETAHGLNPVNPSDGNGDKDGDGYTNVEEYLNELAGGTEPVPSPAPAPPSMFSDQDPYLGDSSSWEPLTPERWAVVSDAGDFRYGIVSSEFSNLSGGRLGEYSLIRNRTYDNFRLSAKVRSTEDLPSNSAADFAVIFGYRDPRNYWFMMINSDQENNQLFHILDGSRQLVATANNFAMPDDRYHVLTVEKVGESIKVLFDGIVIIDANTGTVAPGRIGIGSFNDASLWDDIRVEEIQITRPAPPSGLHIIK